MPFLRQCVYNTTSEGDAMNKKEMPFAAQRSMYKEIRRERRWVKNSTCL